MLGCLQNSPLTHQALEVVCSCCPIALQELGLTQERAAGGDLAPQLHMLCMGSSSL